MVNEPHPSPAESAQVLPPSVSAGRGLSWLRLTLRAVCGLAVLAFLVDRIGASQILHALQACRPGYVLLAAAVYCVGQAWSTLKWWNIARFLGHRASYLRCLRFYFIGMFLNLFLPSIVGGDGYRIAALSSASGGPVSQAATSVFLERVTGVYALVLVALVASMLTGVALAGMPLYVPLALLFAAMAILAMSVPLLRPMMASRGLRRLKPGGRLGGAITTFHDAHLKFHHHSGILAVTLAMSVVFQSTVPVVALLAGLGLDIHVHLLYFLAFVPVITLATMLPITINGIGIREAAYVFLLSQVAVPDAQAVSLSLVYLGTVMLASSLGGLAWLVWGSGLRARALLRPSGGGTGT